MDNLFDKNYIPKNVDGMTVEQKFARCLVKLRVLRPFYSAVYEVMEKVPTESVETMAVDTNRLLYNPKFVDEIKFDEMMFVILHEVAHVALQHVSRRENRDPFLWNIAADLFVNATLANEFNLSINKPNTYNNVKISMMEGCVYASSLDTDIDYTEDIYDKLESQAVKNGYIKSKGSLDGNDGSGQSNEQGQGIGTSKSSRFNPDKLYSFSYTGSKSKYYDSGSDKNWNYNFSVKPNDVYDLASTGDSSDVMKQKAEKIIQDALTRVEMSSSGVGNGTGLMGMAQKMLKSELNWKKLLNKYLIAISSTDSSFSKPDKRMYYQKSIYPGQVESESGLYGVKVCIDVSGSVSDKDIAYFCGQVYSLTKKYKVEAELIYWDADIKSTGNFTDYQQFSRVKMVGRGGTDPSVVFNYFDSKQCKIKPAVVLMFTDGEFSQEGITGKQARKYKDTIWVMTKEHMTNFKPKMGRKAVAKFPNDDRQ